jgi:hypothetical protein
MPLANDISRKVYSCRNFVVPWTKHAVFAHESIGGWAACQKCAEMIDGIRWADLRTVH